MAKPNYFMFDSELWEEGNFYNCTTNNSGIAIERENGTNEDINNLFARAIYFSSDLDSGEKETIWHRMKMDFVLNGDASITFSYYASDSGVIEFDGEKVYLNHVLESGIPIVEKLSILDTIWIDKVQNIDDSFLFKAKGRYLWFKIELKSHDENFPQINSLKIEFPMDSITRLLPEIYTKDEQSYSFLSRYLGIYQSLIYDLQDEIDDITKFFDSQTTRNDFLLWLSQWVSIDNPYIWSEEQLRNLIKRSFSIYRKKGTKEGVSDIVEIYTKHKPIIVETYEVERIGGMVYRDSPYKQLYGDDCYSFFILIQEEYINNHQKFMELKRIIDAFKPANTTANIVVLKPFIVLGKHSYIGINSNISNNSQLELSGNTMLPFNTTILG